MIFLKTRPQETLFRSFQLLVSVNGSFTNQQANVLCLGSQVKAKDNNDNAAGDDEDMMIMIDGEDQFDHDGKKGAIYQMINRRQHGRVH